MALARLEKTRLFDLSEFERASDQKDAHDDEIGASANRDGTKKCPGHVSTCHNIVTWSNVNNYDPFRALSD